MIPGKTLIVSRSGLFVVPGVVSGCHFLSQQLDLGDLFGYLVGRIFVDQGSGFDHVVGCVRQIIHSFGVGCHGRQHYAYFLGYTLQNSSLRSSVSVLPSPCLHHVVVASAVKVWTACDRRVLSGVPCHSAKLTQAWYQENDIQKL